MPLYRGLDRAALDAAHDNRAAVAVSARILADTARVRELVAP